ncbi:MAG: Dps family protein [Marinifilaceae bacterium]
MTVNIGLDERVIKISSRVLRNLMADNTVLLFKTWNFHWNVKGANFKAYHTFLEEIYDGIFENIDAIAERIRALGERPLGSLHDCLEHNRIKEVTEDQELPCANGMLKILSEDIDATIREIRNDLATMESEGSNDSGTMNFLEDMIEKQEKLAWMIRSYVIDDCDKKK